MVEIRILRRSNPQCIDYWDGNWLDSEIRIDVTGFNGFLGANLRADDFEHFYNDLKMLKNNLIKVIEFKTIEEGLYLQGTLDMTGIIRWDGIAKSSYCENYLTFFMETDFEVIDELFVQTQDILSEYPVVGVN